MTYNATELKRQAANYSETLPTIFCVFLSVMITEKHQREFGVYAARLHPVFSSSHRANLT